MKFSPLSTTFGNFIAVLFVPLLLVIRMVNKILTCICLSSLAMCLVVLPVFCDESLVVLFAIQTATSGYGVFVLFAIFASVIGVDLAELFGALLCLFAMGLPVHKLFFVNIRSVGRTILDITRLLTGYSPAAGLIPFGCATFNTWLTVECGSVVHLSRLSK